MLIAEIEEQERLEIQLANKISNMMRDAPNVKNDEAIFYFRLEQLKEELHDLRVNMANL
jgi:hypothetical protein